MKRSILLTFAFVGTILLASCGGSTEDRVKKQADQMFSQAETTVKGIDNMDDFFSFIDELTEKKQNFILEVVAPAYGVDDTTFNVPEEVSNYFYERATAYNKVEGDKYAELIEPYIANLEAATDAALQATDKAEKTALTDQASEAYNAILPYAAYDNVIPELQERFMAVIEKLEQLL